MSRIGKAPIVIPAGVTVKVDNNVVTVKGPKGELTQDFHSDLTVALEDNHVVVTRPSDSIEHRSQHGLVRALIHNMVVGVSQGYQKSLLINGVGYRAEVNGNIVLLTLGYSTQIEYVIPEGISIAAEGPAKLIISGIDKARVGKVAAEIRSLRGPEPYKGKGIKYEDETIRRKVGKSGGKK